MSLLFFQSAQADVDSSINFVTESLPPYQVVNGQGELIGGTSYALVRYIAQQAGIKANIKVMPWARAYRTALTEPNTFIFSMARSPAREDKFIWLGRLRELRYHFYSYSSSNPKPDVLTDLFNKQIATVRDSIEEALLLELGFEFGKNLIQVGDYRSALEMVYRRRADAIYANEYVVQGISNVLGHKKSPFVVIFTLNQGLELYVAANKNSDEELVNRFKNTFDNVFDSGIAKQIIAEQEWQIFSNSMNEAASENSSN